MTDARLPERLLIDRRALLTSPGAWRLYTFGLMYAVANRSDGLIRRADLPLIPTVDPAYTSELADLGLWERQSDGWMITDYAVTQTSRDELAQLERIRAADRDKKRKQRLSPGLSPGRVPGTAQDRKGRTGQAGKAGSDRSNWPEGSHGEAAGQ